MFWVKAVSESNGKLLIVDTSDKTEEWHDIRSVKALLELGTIQIFGVKMSKGRYLVSATEDPRAFLLGELKVLARREGYSRFDVDLSNPDCLAVRYFGAWEVSVDDKQEMIRDTGVVEEDWGWKVLTQSTANAVVALLSRIEQKYGYRFVYSMGEKEWLYFSDK